MQKWKRTLIMEDASHVDVDEWCITVGGVSAFPVDTQAILQRGSGFLRDCLREGRLPKLASLPTPWVNFLFETQRFFMLGKCILKIKRHPMTSSGFHGI